MLYISTRSAVETYTAHVSLTKKYAPDGGCIVPMRLPVYSREEIADMRNKPFNQIVADILNQFFSARLTLWDMDLVAGKNGIRTSVMNHRLMVAELWHNPIGDFSYVIDRIRGRLVQDARSEMTPWLKIAVWIAEYFAIYGQLLSEGILDDGVDFDVVVSADDLLMPVAAHYARRMGLPVNTIICSCSGETYLWDLMRRGSMVTSLDSPTISNVESLLYAVLGERAVNCFLHDCDKKRVYTLEPLQLQVFTDNFYCTVAGKSRADSTINSFFRSNRYIVDPPAAICYSGLQDFRAGTGSSRMTLLLSEHTPLDYVSQISAATGIPKNKLYEYVKL